MSGLLDTMHTISAIIGALAILCGVAALAMVGLFAVAERWAKIRFAANVLSAAAGRVSHAERALKSMRKRPAERLLSDLSDQMDEWSQSENAKANAEHPNGDAAAMSQALAKRDIAERILNFIKAWER